MLRAVNISHVVIEFVALEKCTQIL